MSKKPMRIFEGSGKPYQPFWRIVDAAESESGEAEIEFYGYISEYSWWDDDITPSRFKKDLAALNGAPVTVRIHSGGGDVFAASAIRAMLMDYPGKVTTRIDGLCASAATYVAMAGDRVLMQDSAFFMVHNPAALAYGQEQDLKNAIKLLKTVKDGIIQTYQGKTKMEAERISKLMDAETWMTAQEALEMGFVDQIVTDRGGAREGRMQMVGILNCLEGAPDEVLAAFGGEDAVESVEQGEPMGSGEEVQEEEEVIEDVAGEESAVVETEPVAEEEPDLTASEQPEDGAVNGLMEAELKKLRDWLDVFTPRKEVVE